MFVYLCKLMFLTFVL